MNEIKRFSAHGTGLDPYLDANGVYMLYCDHQQALAERDKTVADLAQELHSADARFNMAKAARDAGDKRIAELEKEFSAGQDGEKCQKCGRRYDTVWTADAIWNTVIGHENGLYCPMCFDRMCRDRGIYLSWYAYGVETPPEKDKRIADLKAKLAEIRKAAEPVIESLFVWGSDTEAERLQDALDFDKGKTQEAPDAPAEKKEKQDVHPDFDTHPGW